MFSLIENLDILDMLPATEKHNDKIKKQEKKIYDKQNKLLETLSKKQQTKFMAYENEVGAMMAYQSTKDFEKGFKLAPRLLLEALT